MAKNKEVYVVDHKPYIQTARAGENLRITPTYPCDIREVETKKLVMRIGGDVENPLGVANGIAELINKQDKLILPI